MDDRTEGTEYWKVKEEAQDRNVCRTRFGISYEPVARQATGLMNMLFFHYITFVYPVLARYD
jgi:hypothetical protein